MRILVAINASREHPGGMMRLMRFLHEPLTAAGHEVEYFCSEDVPARWNGNFVRRFAFPWLVYRKARKAFEQGRAYDIINIDEPISGLVAYLKHRVGSRIVITSSGLDARSRQLNWQSRAGLANADHVFCLNDDDRQYLKVHFDLTNASITRIFPGAAPIDAERAASRDYARCQLLLFAGTLRKNKGIEDLVPAVIELLQGHSEMEFHVLEGGGIPKAELLSCFTPALHERIHLHHPKSDAENAAIMAQSDIFVLPNLFEGSPLTLVEAMASGLPIVTTATNGRRDLIDDGRNGLLVSLRSPRALVRSVQRLIADRNLRRSLGQEAQRDAATRYTRASAVDSLQRGYEQVLQLRPLTSGRSPRMIFVTHVSRDGDTAVYRNTRDRVAYLESQGCECTILSPDDFSWLRRLGARFNPLLYPLAVAGWLFHRAKNYHVATFHSYAGWLVLSLSRILGRFRRMRTVVQFHGLEPLYYARLEAESHRAGHPLSWRYRLVNGSLMPRLLERACHRADLVLCLNSEELRFLVDHGWADPGGIHMIANPAPQLFFIPRQHRPRAQRLLFVGQWLEMKGTRYLAEAFTRLLREHPDLHLCCAGTLESSEAVLRAFPENARDNVSVHPRVSRSELLEILQASDLFVFPTLSEGFSLALVEAMASGLPIVTTPVGASSDILQDGLSVVFCPPHDATSLTSRIAELLDDCGRREQLGGNAQQAAEKFRPELVWRDYAVCLNQLAERDIEEGRRMPIASATERD